MGPGLIVGLLFIGGSAIFGYIAEVRKEKKEIEKQKKEEEEKKQKELEEERKKQRAKNLLERRKKLDGNRDWSNHNESDKDKEDNQEPKPEKEENIDDNDKDKNPNSSKKPATFRILRKSPQNSSSNAGNNDNSESKIEKEDLEELSKKEANIENLNDAASLLKAKLLKYKRNLKERSNHQKDRIASIEWTVLYLNRYLNDNLSVDDYNEINKLLEIYKKMDKVTFELYYKNLVNKYGDKLKENRIINQKDRDIKNMIFAFAHDESNWISEEIDLLTKDNNNEYLLDDNKLHWVNIEEALGDNKLEVSDKNSKDIREAVRALKKDLIEFKANIFVHKKENPLTKIRKVRGIDNLIDHLDRTNGKLSIEELEVTLDHIWFYSNLKDEKKALEKVVEIKKEINLFEEPSFPRSQDKRKYDEILKDKRILKERLILLNIFINKSRGTFKEIGFHRKGMHPEIPHRKENFERKNKIYKKIRKGSKRKKNNPNTKSKTVITKINININNTNLTKRADDLNNSQNPKSKQKKSKSKIKSKTSKKKNR